MGVELCFEQRVVLGQIEAKERAADVKSSNTCHDIQGLAYKVFWCLHCLYRVETRRDDLRRHR